MEPITDDRVAKAYDSAPEHIRNHIGEGRLAGFVASMASRYSLSGDMRQKLAIACRDSLLKLIGPEEFEKNILLLGTTREAELAIAEDFREAMKVVVSPSLGVEKEITPVTQEPSVPPGTPVARIVETSKEVTVPAPKPFVPPSAPEPLASVPAYTPAPPQIVVPAPVMPSVPPPPPIPVSLPPVPEAPRAVPVPEPTPVPPPQPIRPRTMASDVEALQNPGETPMRAPVPPPQPVTPTPVPKAIPQPPRPATPVPNASAVHEDLKKYGIDPYREPVA